MTCFKRAVKLGLTCAVFALLISAAQASTIQVGCLGSLYHTIQDGVNAANSGDTVLVCKGIYAENVSVTTSDLTIKAANQVLLVPGDSTVPGFDVFANGVTIENFEIRGFGGSSGIEVDKFGSQPVGGELFKNNNIHNNGTGIALDHSSGNNWVTNNSVHNNSGDGIFDNGTAGSDYFVSNQAFQNGGTGGIVIANTSAANSAYLIDNQVKGNTADGVYLNFASNVSLEHNLMSSNGNDGFEAEGSNTNCIIGNSADANGNNGLEFHSDSIYSEVKSNKMYGNASFDATDHSGGGSGPGGVSNAWTNDHCLKDSPVGLCKHP